MIYISGSITDRYVSHIGFVAHSSIASVVSDMSDVLYFCDLSGA